MKNTIKWFGVIAFVAVIGFSMVSCGDDDDDDGGGIKVNWVGTWVGVDDPDFYFTLNADKSWTLYNGLSGSKWKYDKIGLGIYPAIVLVYIDSSGGEVGEYLSIKEIIDSKTVEFINSRGGERYKCKKQ